MTPNEIAIEVALEHKHSLRSQRRRQRRTAAVVALTLIGVVVAFGGLTLLVWN